MVNIKSTKQTTPKTQLDKANAVLMGLSSDITSSDRKAAEEELNYTRFTIATYLKGEGKDLDITMIFVEFFQKRIEERNKKLAGAAQVSSHKKIA